VEYCHKNKIIVEAYSPLVRAQKTHSEVLVKLAKKYNKSTSQILIRYCLQKDWVPLPKSDTPSRIKENAEVYDFEIFSEDMKTLNDLDQGAAGSIVQAVKNDSTGGNV
jgi:diketogulonate reductase-like aldo/keto reductase